ncbi:MAG: sulfatase [Armatimonadota bacterium]
MRIVYLDLDCMRPDHFGSHGYHRQTTPNLDRLVHQGVRFTRCYCSDSPCVPSRAALFSGRFGVHNGVATHWGPGSQFRYRDDIPMLARHLYANGYNTVSFSSFADRHQAWWFAAGWRELHTFTLKRGGENADEVNAAVIPWLRNHAAEDDYFLHIHYWDPHRVYTMPVEWMQRFQDDPPPDWPDQAAIDEHQKTYGPFTAPELFPGRLEGSPAPTMPAQIATVADWKHFVDGYDGAVAYMDDHIGQVLEAFERAGVLDDTAFIISGDHAEAMGEFGVYGDHVCASESVHNIPMVVRWPGVTPQDVACDDPVYNVDLPPTLCDLLGLTIPPGWDGRSFAPQVRGQQGQPRDHVVWTHGLYSCQRVLRTDRWLLCRTYHPGLYPFEPLALYDMAADPRQTTDVSADNAEIVHELDHLLAQWHQDNLGRHGAEPDPLQEVIHTGPWKYVRLAEWLQHLRQKGRDDAAREIEQRLGLAGDV